MLLGFLLCARMSYVCLGTQKLLLEIAGWRVKCSDPVTWDCNAQSDSAEQMINKVTSGGAGGNIGYPKFPLGST